MSFYWLPSILTLLPSRWVDNTNSLLSLPLSHTLAIRPNRPSLLVSPLNGTLGLHRLGEYKFLLGGRLTLLCPCKEDHGRRMLMSSSFLLQQWPVCLDRLTSMFCEMAGKWQYSCCFVGASSRMCSKWRRCSHLYFSSRVSLKFTWRNHTIVLTRLQLRIYPV